jgi:hypothetical protein
MDRNVYSAAGKAQIDTVFEKTAAVTNTKINPAKYGPGPAASPISSRRLRTAALTLIQSPG